MHGRLVAARLTSIPGSSDVVRGGIVAYDNGIKEELLGVSPELLAEHGAVSAEVAAAMATGARERLGVDVAVSVTGIAGPGGGTPEKPVGLVFFHASGPMGEQVPALRAAGRTGVDPRPGGRVRAPSRAAPARGLTLVLASTAFPAAIYGTPADTRLTRPRG